MPTNGKQDVSGNADTTFIEPAAQHHYKFKEPWTVLALDNIQGFLIQLACGGGAGAIAKTAVAPLERVKVKQGTFESAADTSKVLNLEESACVDKHLG